MTDPVRRLAQEVVDWWDAWTASVDPTSVEDPPIEELRKALQSGSPASQLNNKAESAIEVFNLKDRPLQAPVFPRPGKSWFVGKVVFLASDQDDATRRITDRDRSFAAAKIFEMDDKEFKALWPGIRRLL